MAFDITFKGLSYYQTEQKRFSIVSVFASLPTDFRVKLQIRYILDGIFCVVFFSNS